MFDAAEAAFVDVDVLVNNAGLMIVKSVVDTGRICRGSCFPGGTDGAWINGQVLRANGGMV